MKDRNYEYVGMDRLMDQRRRARRRERLVLAAAGVLGWVLLTLAVIGALIAVVAALAGPREAMAETLAVPAAVGQVSEGPAVVRDNVLPAGGAVVMEAGVAPVQPDGPAPAEETDAGQQDGIEDMPGEAWECVGEVTLTAYCNCRICCGRWAGGPTASGAMPEAGRTIAVDPDVIPLGSRVYIAGYGEYVAEDTGSAIVGARIDVYMDSHEEARHFADGAGSCVRKAWIIR